MSGPPAKRVRTDDEISSNPVEDGATHTEAWSRPLVPPACLMEDLPVSPELSEQIANWRAGVAAIVEGQDDRLVVIVGPCSIHDVKVAKEYAQRLQKLAVGLKEDLLVVMRVYFEKPRTTVGWKGLINDPHLDGTFNINKGLRMGRELLRDINAIGVGCAVEFLDTISPQYIADLVCWGAIGARTTESQVHRELASGLSMPIGFKNGTGGSIQIAVDAIRCSKSPHVFLGISKQSVTSVIHTKGNPHAHLILRGGGGKTNFDAASVGAATTAMEQGGVRQAVIVDCSHDNSKKNPENQPAVAADVAKQVAAGNKSIVGLMIESHINGGKQKLEPGVTNPADLKYGVSVTDGCIDWDTTVESLLLLATAVQQRRAAVSA